MSNHTQRTLQDWQDYIHDYEDKLAAEKQSLDTILADPNKTAEEKKKALDDYTRNKMFLQELQDKYNEYSLEGEVPDEVTFGGGDPTSVIVYKTNIPDDEDTIHYGSVGTISGSGDLSTPNSEIPLGTIFQSDLININVKVYESQGYTQPQYDDITIGQQYLVDSGGTVYWHIKSNVALPYGMVNRFSVSGIPGTTISDDAWSNSDDRIVIEATWGNITNIRTINQNTTYTVSTFLLTLLSMLTNPEGTVDGDSPWDYYDKIKPSVNPDNNLYPDGYEPPRDNSDEDPDTDEPVPGPDKNDRGDKGLPKIDGEQYPAIASPFVSYGIFKYEDLVDLSEQLWDKPDNFFEGLSAAQKVNPMDYFISLRWYPIILDSISAEESDLFLGRGGKLIVNHKRLSKTVFISDFGKIKIKPHYENFLDYDPYTKIYIFLPFCGQIELNSCVVMNKDLSLNCAIDVSDGSICWQLYNDTDGQPIFTKQAKCGCDIPITSADASQMGANIVNATLGLLNAVGKTGADIYTGAVSAMEKAAPTGAEGIVAGGTSTTGGLTKAAIAGGAYGLAKNITNIISACSNLGMASKEIPQMTGSVAGLAASLVDRCAYIIYQRPLSTNPDTYGHTVGFIHNKTALISETHGFTICKNADVSGISQATTREKEEIKHILDNGFFA